MTTTTISSSPRDAVTDALRRVVVLRTVSGVVAAVLGSVALVAALVLLESAPVDARDKKADTVVRFDVELPKETKRKERKESKRTKRASRAATAGVAAPSFSSSIALPSLASSDDVTGETGLADDITAKADDVVMTDDVVDEAPRAVAKVAPVHPPRARRAGVEGEVTIALVIDTEGRVVEPRVVSSTPPGTFDEAALSAIARWRFSPARYRGEPVRVKRTITFTFALE